MANEIFLMKLIFLAALVVATLTQLTQPQPDRLISTLSQKSFQDRGSCLEQLMTKLFGFLKEIYPPEKASDSKIVHFGKEALEMISKKLNVMMSNCQNGASLRVTPIVVTHLNKIGRNFYVEQLFIQKIVLKPIVVVEQTNAKEIEILKIRENEKSVEKTQLEIDNIKKDQMLAELDFKIETLMYAIGDMTRDYEREKTSGEFYYAKYQKVETELGVEKKKFEDLNAIYLDIIKNACGCQRCRVFLGNMQTPNWFPNFQASRTSK